MKRTIAELNEIIAAVELQSVRLVEAAAKTTIRTPSEAGSVAMSVEWDAKLSGRTHDGFYVTAVMEARVAPKATPKAPAMSIRAVFELKYSLTPDVTASDDQLNKFSRINGVFNAWPYGREFIQNTSTRMNLPPVVVPVFRLKDVLSSGPSATLPEATQRLRREARGRRVRRARAS
jgi:hypothetical protein